MTQPFYTLNCDLGEGIPDESSIIPWVDLASVACGGHFGDETTIRETLRLVKRFGKKAGAHPSYPDRLHFGRRSLEIQPQDLIRSLSDQLALFLEIANEEKVGLDHIKFHGALHNDTAENRDLALLLVKAIKEEFPQTPLFVPPKSEIEQVALELNHPIKREVFGDRAYQTNYKLVSRTLENSLFTQCKQVISHLESIIEKGQIQTSSGERIPVEADTICIHGDNPGILGFLPTVRKQFWK
ncbi:LamB/YcsF family protein [Algoriphagus boritolerans]|uniref:UPF0271 protein n=1 Tax=Algoriphagus boritolerans DSM 17298 = JCM 18970 TaxID=1120964 RepID=A0A1H6A7Z6_9BACT|nr:LamB/YcsF family protein [Algoriphagus boritolerans]SEG44502.1 UPF0271 protein [Algoriphagus boritolerans DSM 17298 = JCM 18970]